MTMDLRRSRRWIFVDDDDGSSSITKKEGGQDTKVATYRNTDTGLNIVVDVSAIVIVNGDVVVFVYVNGHIHCWCWDL